MSAKSKVIPHKSLADRYDNLADFWLASAKYWRDRDFHLSMIIQASDRASHYAKKAQEARNIPCYPIMENSEWDNWRKQMQEQMIKVSY